MHGCPWTETDKKDTQSFTDLARFSRSILVLQMNDGIYLGTMMLVYLLCSKRQHVRGMSVHIHV